VTQSTAHQVFAAAFEYAAIGMAVLDAQGRLERVNPALCEMLGYSAPELCRIGLGAVVHPDDLPEDAASRDALARGRLPRDRRELRYRHQGGRTVWGSLTRILVRDELGQPSGFIDQVQDLTERRRAEKEIVLLNNLLEQRIRRRTAELEESNEDLRDFAYSLAHDLRAPLASIDGFSAQLELLVGHQAEGRAAHYLQRVRAGVQQMAQLTDGLLALADLARTELQHQSVDLSFIAAAILERLREQQPERDVQVQVLPTPPAKGDPRLLADVLENLLGNAWKFTGRTAGARIAFGAWMQSDGSCCYHVRDNGAGFDPAYGSKLFTPFQRLHTSAEFEGTGIGLAMVRKIVTRHGGRIWAESRPGEGACFFFTLGETGPIAPAHGDSGY
jgi:PAS domain S-box-containing protein